MNTPVAVSIMPVVTTRASTESLDETGGTGAEDDHERHDRQHAQPGLERAVAEHELEQLADDEEEAEHGQEDEHHPDAGDTEAAVLEQAHVEHR